MKALVLIFAVFALSACSDETVSDYFVDTELQPHLESFIKDANARGSYPEISNFSESWRFHMKLGSFENAYTLGSCRLTERTVNKSAKERVIHQDRVLTFSTYHWNRMTDLSKWEVVYHELAHCTLKRMHDNEITDFTRSNQTYRAGASIMNSYSLSMQYSTHVRNFIDYYTDELFGLKSTASRIQIPQISVASMVREKLSANRGPASVVDQEQSSDDCVFSEHLDERGNPVSEVVCEIRLNKCEGHNH